jgi:Holliday junction DNA helicase RuvB
MQRVVEIEKFEDEIKSELSLKPTTWDEYIGQEKIKKNLQVFIEASKKRAEALDHMLFLDLRDSAKQP